MEGLFVGQEKKFISQISHSSSVLSLLANADGVDVMLYEVEGGRPGSITPSEDSDMMEFFYVISGSAVLKTDEEDILIRGGQHFYIYNLKSNIQFTTENGIKILYVTSRPTFNLINSYNKELSELLAETEKKDIYTFNHGNRVQMYSVKLCEKMKLSSDIIYSLAVSSLFHDVGKCNIPDTILKKNGPLTAEEFGVIKKHPVDGAELVKGKFRNDVHKIILQHHERINGSGYPNGLAEDEIILEAKIIAITDSFDAMTSDRAYRKAMTREAAMHEIESLTGTYYDPDISRAFIEVIEDIRNK